MKVKFESSVSTTEGYYIVEPKDAMDNTYVGDWAIDSDVLYHRHPKEVAHQGFDGFGTIEYDVNDRVCWRCKARCPNGVWMAHRLYQL